MVNSEGPLTIHHSLFTPFCISSPTTNSLLLKNFLSKSLHLGITVTILHSQSNLPLKDVHSKILSEEASQVPNPFEN